jgi:hypothetical protein
MVLINSDAFFIENCFVDREYLPRSYFSRGTVENDSEPDVSCSVTIFEISTSRRQLDERLMKLFVRSAGADSPRPITLRKKPSTGQWFLWNHSLLVGIREPATKAPWR